MPKLACPDVTEKIMSFKYEDQETKADKMEMKIENADLRNFDEPIFSVNNYIYVQWGYVDALTIERKMVIKKVTGFKELTIHAYGLETVLDNIEEVKTYKPQPVSETARQIAARWGYVSPSLLHITDSGFIQPTIVQAKMSDAALMRKLAAQLHWIWYIDFDGFHFHPRDFYRNTVYNPTLTLKYSGDQTTTEILDIDIDVDVTRIPVVVKAQMAEQRQRFALNINKNSMNAKNAAYIAEKQLATGTFEPASGYNGTEHQKVERPRLKARTSGEADEVASRLFNTRQLDAVTMKVKTIGDPNIYAKHVVQIENIGMRLSQAYYITGVTHSIDKGYTCELACKSDGIGGRKTNSNYAKEANLINVGTGVAAVGSHYDYSPDKGDATRTDNKSAPQNPASAEPEPVLHQSDDKIPTAADPYANAIVPGNLDLRHRPVVRLRNGDIATTYSRTVKLSDYGDGAAKGWMNVPGITHEGYVFEDQPSGGPTGDDQAYAYYQQTSHEHLGIFSTLDDAIASAQAVHLNQEIIPPQNTMPIVVEQPEHPVELLPIVPSSRAPFAPEPEPIDPRYPRNVTNPFAPEPEITPRNPFAPAPETQAPEVDPYLPKGIITSPVEATPVPIDAAPALIGGADGTGTTVPLQVETPQGSKIINVDPVNIDVSTAERLQQQSDAALNAVYKANRGITAITPYQYNYDTAPYAVDPSTNERVPVAPMAVENGAWWTVLPQVSRDGTFLSESAALSNYRETGEYLGNYKTKQEAVDAQNAITNYLTKYPPKDSTGGK